MPGWVHLDVDLVVRETDKALLLRLEGGEEVWVPKSAVADAGDYAEGDADATVSVAAWWAEREGLG